MIRRILKETHIILFKTMVMPAFSCSSEAWILTEEVRQKIETADMNVPKKDQIRETVIANEILY
jgi:hypothetical protein